MVADYDYLLILDIPCILQYGTDLMESSVKTLSKPVINRVVGPSLAGQLDDFACRQLDRVGVHCISEGQHFLVKAVAMAWVLADAELSSHSMTVRPDP